MAVDQIFDICKFFLQSISNFKTFFKKKKIKYSFEKKKKSSFCSERSGFHFIFSTSELFTEKSYPNRHCTELFSFQLNTFFFWKTFWTARWMITTLTLLLYVGRFKRLYMLYVFLSVICFCRKKIFFSQHLWQGSVNAKSKSVKSWNTCNSARSNISINHPELMSALFPGSPERYDGPVLHY